MEQNLYKPTFITNKVIDHVVKEIVETEKLVLSTGQYFGDCGILEKRPRRASAVAVDDTDLFIIDANNFENSFGVNIFKFI